MISRITDPIGRTVSYTYNNAGYLATFTNVLGGVTQYEYDSQNLLTRITDPRGIVVSTTYDTNGRASSQTLPSGGVMRFAYTLVNPLVPNSPVTQTVVTDALGNATSYRWNTQGFLVGVTDAAGQVRSFTREFGTNLVTSITGNGVCDECENTQAGNVSYTYDAFGNQLTRTDGLGNTVSYTYDPVYNRLTSMTDPSGNVTRFAYDSHANPITITDARGNTTTLTYPSLGLTGSLTDAAGQTTSYGYDAMGNVTTVTDPLGNVTHLAYDGISRRTSQQDARGATTSVTWNAMGELTKVVEGNGRTTTFSYDLAGYVHSYTVSSGGTVSLGYDNAGRRATRTDQLGKTTTWGYDAMSNNISLINRRGQSAAFSYDALNRLVKETYVDATVSRSYDAYGRLNQVVDSASGTFTFAYDAIGNLLQQVGPFGAVDYTRDANGRVATRQVEGDPVVTYAYDPDGNLTNASMTGASVSQTFDARNRLSAVSRGNGVNGAYSYDPLGRPLSIAEKNGSTSIVSRAYGYDALGRVVSRTLEAGFPLATPSSTSTFNAADQIVSGGALSSTFTADADGDRLTDKSASGTSSYTWDGRGRLQAVSAAGTVTDFRYDFNGNLIQKQVASGGVQGSSVENYILDDLTNVVKQDKVGVGGVSFLTGRRIDQTFAMVSGGNPVFPLVDNLSSTVALTNGSGNVTGNVYYEPYGKTTESGATDLLEFTSRQQVAQDLYYVRARYLDVRNGRFMSQDPRASGEAIRTFTVTSATTPPLTSIPSGWIPVSSAGRPTSRSARSTSRSSEGLHGTGKAGSASTTGAAPARESGWV